MTGKFSNCRVVIFDLDGTLLDTLLDLAEATNAALKKHGLPTRSVDEVRRFVGNGIANLIARAMPGGVVTDTVDRFSDDEEMMKIHSEILSDFRAYYNDHCEVNTKPYDGVIDMLKELKNNGIKTAVVSNKADFAVGKLCWNYFGDLVDAAIGENEAAGIRKKPAPDMVFAVLSKINGVVEPKTDHKQNGRIDSEKAIIPAEYEQTKGVIYVGDSDVDIRTAAAAGMPCISVLWGFRSRDFLLKNGATALISDPKELLDVVRKN